MTFMMSQYVGIPFQQRSYHVKCCDYLAIHFRECALSGGKEVMCTHRIKMGDSEQWHYISQQCRDRVRRGGGGGRGVWEGKRAGMRDT